MPRLQGRFCLSLSRFAEQTLSKRGFQSSLASRAKVTSSLTTEIMSGAAEHPPPLQAQPDYSTWSTSHLISRITELERQLNSRTAEYTPTLPQAASDAAPANPPPVAPPADTPADAAQSVASDNTSQQKPLPEDDITHAKAPSRPPKQARMIDPSKYHTRFIALKFAYLGQRYNGLEHTNGNITPLPTIEEMVWKALRRTRLIFPTNESGDFEDSNEPRALKPYSINWEGCQYSKAGRTDRGVSAFGQVIGIRVRSARPKVNKPAQSDASGDTTMETEVEDKWDDIADELPYITMLNKALPEDIRVLAWCPHPPEDFDARFSCRERRYRYFFTQPAFSPTPGPLGFISPNKNKSSAPKYREGWLDIEAMREAAKRFEGVHDFRNFCKLDTSKQIENFTRIIHHSDIELLDPKTSPLGYVGQPGFRAVEHAALDTSDKSSNIASPDSSQVYVFNLHGSAFLWHQVRHMVSILFLVGQGLESPSIVSDLLDVTNNPRKPNYEMASDAPLVLWDCIFPDLQGNSRQDSLEWVYAGDLRQSKTQLGKGSGKFGAGGVVDDLWSVWRQRKIDEVLAGALLDLSISQGDQTIVHKEAENAVAEMQKRGQKLFHGGHIVRTGGQYVPVLQKRKSETVEAQNARWLASKQRKTASQGEDSSRLDV